MLPTEEIMSSPSTSPQISLNRPFLTTASPSYGSPNRRGASPVTPRTGYITSTYNYSPSHSCPVSCGSSPGAGQVTDLQATVAAATLLKAVAALGPLRQARRRKYVDAVSARRDAEWEAARERDEAAARAELVENAEKARQQRRNAEWLAEVQAAEKRKQEKRARLTTEQAEDKIQWHIDHYKQRHELLRQRPGESHSKWMQRTERLNTRIIHAWKESRWCNKAGYSVLRGGYGDVSVAATDGPPRVMPHFSRMPTRRKACLRCAAEGMECPRTMNYPGHAVDDSRGCSRCLRAGRGCLVMPKDGELGGRQNVAEERVWRYAGRPRSSDQTVEEIRAARKRKKSEVRELMRKRDGVESVFVGGEVVDAQVGNFACPVWG